MPSIRPESVFRLPLLRTLIALALLGGIVGVGRSADARAPVGPDPVLSPAAVVQMQLAALAQVDDPQPGAGLRLVWRFASPQNQAVTGPESRFARMIREGYPEMLNHRAATLAPLVVEGNVALQGVELIDRDGRLHRYVFELSRQADGPYKDCWMTDGVHDAPAEPEVAI